MKNHLTSHHPEEFNTILEARSLYKKTNMVKHSMSVSTYLKSQPNVEYVTPPPSKKRKIYESNDISEFNASVSDEFKEISEYDHLRDSRAPIVL